jgi:hypothetical protein
MIPLLAPEMGHREVPEFQWKASIPNFQKAIANSAACDQCTKYKGKNGTT